MTVTLRTASTLQGVRAFAHKDLKWVNANKPGIRLLPVRATRESGNFLGMLSFDTMINTGIHQHTGPAFSFFMHGGLADYQGIVQPGEMGINLAGATHDAISIAPTLMMSRLDAPVLYPDDGSSQGEALHTGARGAEIVNTTPEVLPDMNVPVDKLPWLATLTGGVQRREIFDYANTALQRRCVQLRLLPGSKLGPLMTSDVIDIYVLGGDLSAGSERAAGGDFMIIDPDVTVTLTTRYGCLAFVWLDGPARACETGEPVLAAF